MITIYGIKNCDTMKKAFAWLDKAGIGYRFHDYKKEGMDQARLTDWCKKVGWKTLVNTRGTTWRKLTTAQQAVSTQADAIALMLDNTSLIKRPVIEKGALVHVGFDPDTLEQLLK